jgi:hypothetical protein
MRNTLVLLAALAATAAIGVGIGVAQGAASSADSNTRAVHLAPRLVAAPFTGRSQTMFAVVSANGTLVRGYGAASAGPIGSTPGIYRVLFMRGVRKCAYSATLGGTGSSGLPPIGEVGVVGLVGHKAGVYVRTFDSTGATTAASFHLVVACTPLA